MAQYIDKDALAAEIKRRIKEIEEIGTYLSQKGVLTNLLCHLDTIEVEKEKPQVCGPKFHKGDWIIFNGATLYIKEVVKDFYKTVSIDGIPNSYDWNIDNAARLWTIQEVRNGDILASKDGDDILIFKDFISDTCFSTHFIIRGRIRINWSSKSFVPATKEQRHTLRRVMADAGYVFDPEKNELKELKQKPTKWSEEDEKRLKNILSVLDVQVCWDGATLKKMNPYQKEIDWLKSLKELIIKLKEE